MKKDDLSWILRLSRPIIVGAKVAKLIKKYYPEIEVIDYEEYSKDNKSNVIYYSQLDDSELLFTYKENADDIMEDIKRGFKLVKNY